MTLMANTAEQFAEGGISMRPEPRPDSVDVSPRAEAGDQFFVEQAERNKPFPNVKPKPRPDLDKNKGRTYDIYSVEIDGRETNVIEFKDGSRLSIPQIEQMFEGSKSATESTPGKQTTKEIINFLESNNPTREEFVKHFTAKRLNKGGAMMDKQMQMAFMDEGGLTDDGMDVDPVSGNDIPSGSMAEEVRDDIPAQLSDGEYVVPADVVRYYGVKFFEDLRERAKMGLQEMEMNGRIGGEPVPDGGPTNTNELSPQEMQAIQEVMGMSNGGSVEQNILDTGNKAISDPYIGQGLGFSLFGDSNTGVQTGGVQQTEVKPFTSITLYNTSGQTRLANSEAEKTKAIADGYTMTLSEYNMYRSKRGGGSGGSGITPPGEGEDGEIKPWGQDVNWNNAADIEQFVAQAERGNLSGSGRFLRGAGFAIAGLPGAALAGAFQVGKGLSSLYDMEAAKIIAEAKGHTELVTKIDQGITDYLKTAGDIANFLYKPGSKAVINKVNGVFAGTGYDNLKTWSENTKPKTVSDFAATTTGSGKGISASKNILDKRKGSGMGKSTVTSTGTGANKQYTSPGTTRVSSETGADTSAAGMKAAKESLKGRETNIGGRNKGGLMTKGKKKK